MSLMESARKWAYWTLDAVKGRPVGKHFDEVRDAYRNGADPKVTEEKLQKLLRHAVDTTAFYRDLTEEGELSLDRFPVMNKAKYLENYDAHISASYRDRPDNRTHQTSGSTGVPFTMVQDKGKAERCTGCSLFINGLGGYELGDRQAFLRVWRVYKKSKIREIMENLFPVNTVVLDDARMKEICEFLKKKRIKSMIGYASSLAALSDYIRDAGVDTSGFKVRSIIAISDHLSPTVRDQLKQQFRCPVNSNYSNEENGILAIQQGGDAYYVDSASYVVELLDLESDVPVKEGEAGRIVLTDLHNYVFPMIRFDTGDTAVAERKVDEKTGKTWLYFKELYGRRSDMIYDIHGKPVSPRAISANMHGAAGIRQWKFVQETKDTYCFYINAEGKVDESAFLPFYEELLGTSICVEYVDEIPVLASGKRKYIENRMIK